MASYSSNVERAKAARKRAEEKKKQQAAAASASSKATTTKKYDSAGKKIVDQTTSLVDRKPNQSKKNTLLNTLDTWGSAVKSFLSRETEEKKRVSPVASTYDAQFTPEYFEKNNAGIKEWQNDSFDKSNTKSRAEQLDVVRKVQAGLRYRFDNGIRDEDDNADPDAMYAFNNSANTFRQQKDLQTMLKGASEQEIREIIDDWQKRIDEAGEGFYKSSTQADLDAVKDYAKKNFSSFANEEMNRIGGEMAKLNVEKKHASMAYDSELLSAANDALDWIQTGNDPIAVVERNAKLREAVDFDTLADQLGDNEMAFTDELRKRLETVAGAETAVQNKNTDAEQNYQARYDALNREMQAAQGVRDDLLTAEKYREMLGASWVPGAADRYNPEDYQWHTQDGERAQYNLPTLMQIMEDPEGAKQQYEQARAAGAGSGMAETFGLVGMMTEEERQLYKALAVTEGEESAQAYFEHLQPELYERETAAHVEEREAFAAQNPILASAASVPEKFLGTLGMTADMIAGREGQNQFTDISQAERATVEQQISEATPWAVVNGTNLMGASYQGFMSYMDSLFGRAVTGVMGGGNVTGDVLLGLGSATEAYSSTYDATDGDVGKALVYGLAAGALEAGAEHMSWGKWSNTGNLDSVTNALKYIVAAGAAEGGEEVISGLGSTLILEPAILKGDSELAQKYKDYTSNGYTGVQAVGRIAKELGWETTLEFFIGSLMGGTAASVNAGVQVGQQAAVDRSLGRQIQEGGNAAAVIRAALESADEGIRKLGSRLAEKIQETGLPQDAETAAELQVVAEAEGLDANGQKVAASALEIKQPEAEAVAAQQPVEEAAPVVEEEPAESITEEIGTSSGAEEKPELEWREQTAEEAVPAEETAPEKVSPEQAKKAVTEIFKGSTRKLGKLYRKMMGALDVEINTKSVEEIKTAVQNRLKQLGEDVIDPVATAIAKLASGEQMTSDELDLLEASTVRQGVLNEVATSLIRNGGREYLSDETVNLMEHRGALQQATTAKGIKVAQKQTAAAPARVQEMVEETVAADEDGSIQTRAQMLGNDEAAKTMISMAEGVTNTRAYATAFEAAYDYGTAGIDPKVASTSKETTVLTPEQFQAAYQAGVKAAAAPVRAAKTGGKVTFAGNLGSRLNEMDSNQRAAINVLRKIASVGTVNIEFFQSEANAEGKYTAENGTYDPKTNTIRIDVNAGRNNVRSANNFALLRVAGHELTHYIKAQNTEGYKALQDFVVKRLPSMGDRSLDALVAEKMIQQPELSYADAVEEVVANGCEMMLKDSTAIQQLAQENKGLFRRVRNWLRNFIVSVKRAFRGVEAHSTEATLIKDLEALQKLWDDALIQASRNVQQGTEKAAPANTETAIKETAVQKQAYDAAAHIDKRTDENIEGMEPFFNAFDDLRGTFAYNMAGIIRNDVANSQPAAKHFVWGADKSQPDVIGEKRLTSDLIAQYKDRYNWSWDQMRKISDTFMESHEQGKPIPNTIAMKRFELMIDDAMTNGFTDLYGVQVAPAVDYIEAKANIEGSNRLGMQYTKDTPEGVAWMDYAFGIEEGIKYKVREPDGDPLHIRDQIRDHLVELNKMTPVYNSNVRLPKDSKNRTILTEWAVGEFESDDLIAERAGFGSVTVKSKRITSAAKYLKTDAERAALLAVPDVIERGIQIASTDNHKSQGWPTWTFGAPVVINGVRGNMGVVVKETTEKFYRVHRILMPDGSEFEFNENKNTGRGRAEGLADDGTLLQLTSSVSENSIADAGENVKKAVRSEQTGSAEFKRWFKDSKIVNEDGSPKLMYHGTPYGGFNVFKDWQYFTDNQQYADVYQNPSASSIRGRYNTATNPATYSVYLSVKKPFDTRIPAVRKIWQNEFYGKWGDGTPLSKRGLPDWTEGIDLVEFIEENEYDFDGIILDEGGTGGYGDEVKDRGISVAVRSSNQVKSATDNIGTFDPNNPDIRYSIRTDILTDRDILADAFEEVATNDTESNYIRQYREKVLDLNEKEARLSEVRSQIREMMFTAGKRDAAFNGQLNRLKNEAKILADYVNKADKRLLGFEKSKPLQNVLARERAKVEKQSAKKRQEAIATIRDRKNATEVLHKIKAVLDDFNRRLKNPTEKSYIPANMVQLVIAAEELIDTRSGREGEKAQAKLAALQGMYERYKSDATFAYVYDPVIADMLNSLSSVVGNKSIYQLNSAELQSVYETLKALKKQVTEAVKLKAGDYARSIIDAGREMIRETQAAAPLAKGKAGEFLNWQLTPDKFFARLAGFKKNSIWSKVAESFSKGTEKMLEIQRDHYYHFKKFTESKEFDKLNDQKHLVDIGLTNDKGDTVKVTRGMMLSAYMHLSNEENARGFMYGGFSIPNLKAYYDGKVKESYGRGSANTRGTAQELYELAQQMNDPSLTEEQLAALEAKHDQLIMEGMNRLEQMRNDIYSQMTQYEKDLVAAVRAWNDGRSQAYINDVTMDLYGIKKASVQNYFPIHRDTAFVNTDFASISRNVNLENWGSLKTRVPSQAPILLTDIAYEMDSSLNQMSRYVGYARAQRDFNKLYNVRMPGMSGSVKKAVSVKFGTGAGKLGVSGEQYIENYIGSITGSRQGQSGPLSLIRRNLVRSTMTLNLRVGFSQLSAIPKAAAEVGWDSMLSGLGSGGIKAIFSKSAREDLAKQNAWFWQRYRGEGGQREFADAKGGNDIISKAWNKMDDITRGKLLNWCQNFDVMSTVSMWSMAKAWARKHTNYAEGSAEFIEAANKKYTDILRNTQAMSTTSEQSDAARTPGDVLNMFTMFKSEAFANFNLLYDAVAKLRKYSADFKAGKNDVTKADVNAAKRHLAGAATSVIIGASLGNALLKLLINALTHSMDNYRDDEDEITLESTLASIGKEVASDTAGMVMLGGELYELFSAWVLKEKYYAPNDMALAELTEAFETLTKYFQDEDRTLDDLLNTSKKLAFNVTNMLGVPAENMKRYWKGAAAWLDEAQSGTLGSWEGGVKRTNSTNYDRLYNAAIAGDDAKFDSVLVELAENGVEEKDARSKFVSGRVKDAYKDGNLTEDEAFDLLVSYGGKDNDEAFWTMDEWSYEGEGNYSQYADLRTALENANASAAQTEIQKLTGHGVKEDSVIKEISKAYNNGTATNIVSLQIRSDRLFTNQAKPKGAKKEDKADPNAFDAFIEAVISGRGLSAEIARLEAKGYTTRNFMTALNQAFGSDDGRYRKMEYYNPSDARILLDRILDAYEAIGKDRNEEIAWINENWEKFVPDTE